MPDDSGERPKPPRIPRPLPDPPAAGWWVSPGLDPRVVRYHDDEGWTKFTCHLGLRGPGPVEESPLVEETPAEPADSEPTDSEIAALPRPGRVTSSLNYDQPHAGWFRDPDEGALNLKSVRYYDGQRWTEFVCEVGLRGPGEIRRKPRTKNRP
jgi:hypothetical protein